MEVKVKMVTGAWANADTGSPIQFQLVADPAKPWKDAVLSELCAAVRNLRPAEVSIDGYKCASPQEILACGTWEQAAGLFHPIRLMLLRDEDKEFVLSFEGKAEKFHLCFRNF